jgi:predicted DsbA family dithiol-disulfide isomerase
MLIQIDYYTDVLCVWAWIVQRRIDEIDAEWGDKVAISNLCIDVFGNTENRIGKGWAERGGFHAFARHVEESAAPYDTAPVNSKVWREIRPASSAMAHLLLKAAAIGAGESAAEKLALAFRRAFFVDAQDIGTKGVLLDVATDAGLDRNVLQSVIDSGQAIAALQADYEQAVKQTIKGSPSWVLNNGRQVLYGNVGYRLISANIDELANRPQGEASWC